MRQLGYRSRLAENGREALAALDDGADIDLLLTDVILSGPLTGKQVADAAQRRRPDLKVLFMSGYTENAIVHHAQRRVRRLAGSFGKPDDPPQPKNVSNRSFTFSPTMIAATIHATVATEREIAN